MSEQAKEAIAADVAEMITRYSFDLGGYTLNRWLDQWLRHYPAVWLPSAVIEALYQGRYKAISVWQILDLWRRRGKPLQHFNREFERMISGRSLQMVFSATPAAQSLIAVAPMLVTADVNGAGALQNGNSLYPVSLQPVQPRSVMPSLTSIAAPPLVLPPQPSPSGFDPDPTAKPAIKPVIKPFEPPQQFQLSLPGEINRTRAMAAKYPIQQFVPNPASSEFHDKLRAIAQALLLANAEAVTTALTVQQFQSSSSPAEAEQPEQPDADSDPNLA